MKHAVLIVFGTRPEAIKMAQVVMALQQSVVCEPLVCVTAGILDQVLDLFAIVPDYDLDIMSSGQDLFDITSRVLLGMAEVIREVKPDVLLVHGDTTNCLAAGLAAFYQQIPLGHVEAGLSTRNLNAPFLEEANRNLFAPFCSVQFAPTQKSRQNLLDEGQPGAKILATGNTVIYALLRARGRVNQYPEQQCQSQFGERLYRRVLDAQRKRVLITVHRRENFGQGFIDLFTAIKTLAQRHLDWEFIYPVHLNPNVQNSTRNIPGGRANVHLIGPLYYLPFLWLMDKADLLLTDSGGAQEEGPSPGKPVLVMRDVTERPEAVYACTVKLVRTGQDNIINGLEELLIDPQAFQAMSRPINPNGDGHGVKRLESHFVGGGEGIEFKASKKQCQH